MGVPQPVVHGTTIYISIVLAFSIMTLFARCLGVCKKDNAQIALVLYPLMGFCAWLLWCVIARLYSPSRARGADCPIPAAGSARGCTSGIRSSCQSTPTSSGHLFVAPRACSWLAWS